jgi:hypothetical protein
MGSHVARSQPEDEDRNIDIMNLIPICIVAA